MSKGIFLLFISLVFVFRINGQIVFDNTVQQILSKPSYENAMVGLHVADLESGETLYSYNSDKLFIPASTMKLISSASALELLGEDYRFETKIAIKGKVGDNGTLMGDLVLVGGADPALGSEYFKDHYSDFIKVWAEKIEAAGIRKINGHLILDASVYDTERVPDTWVWGDIGNYYGVGPNAFTIFDNMFRITFSSPRKVDKLTRITAISPQIEGMIIENEVKSADTNNDNAYVFGGPLDKARVIRGTIPRNRKAFTIKAAIHQPEEIVAQELTKALAKIGVFINGETRFEETREQSLQTIYIQESPRLEEIAEVLNHESVNLFAEHFLKQIAVEKMGKGNNTQAIDLVKKLWDERDNSTEYLFMEDGSGLSHFNAVSPQFFTKLLTTMWQNKSFVSSLPIAGEGTLKRFDTKLLPGNTLQAKSGSMTRVRCYAGYIQCDSGRKLTFSFMFNQFSGSHTALINEIERLFVVLKSSM